MNLQTDADMPLSPTPISASPRRPLSTVNSLLSDTPGLPPLSTSALVDSWKRSAVYQDVQKASTAPPPPLELSSAYTRAQFGLALPRSVVSVLGLVISRRK